METKGERSSFLLAQRQFHYMTEAYPRARGTEPSSIRALWVFPLFHSLAAANAVHVPPP